MNPFPTNLAYHYVAIALMLIQVNFFCGRTGVGSNLTFSEKDVSSASHVGPPSESRFSGSIMTDKFFFGFISGHLTHFKDVSLMTANLSDAELSQMNLNLAKQRSLIETNEAYKLATNWLNLMGIDIHTMGTTYSCHVQQRVFFPDHRLNNVTNSLTMSLPIFDVEWHGPLKLRTHTIPNLCLVRITISGVSKKLLGFDIQDDSLVLRPPIDIKDRQKLLAITDDEFVKYTDTQRSDLVHRFSDMQKEIGSSAQQGKTH